MSNTQKPISLEDVTAEKNLRIHVTEDTEDAMNGERGRTQSGRWRKKRSDAGKKRRKKKGLLDWIFE